MIYYSTSNGKPFIRTDDFKHAFKLLCDYQDLKEEIPTILKKILKYQKKKDFRKD